MEPYKHSPETESSQPVQPAFNQNVVSATTRKHSSKMLVITVTSVLFISAVIGAYFLGRNSIKTPEVTTNTGLISADASSQAELKDLEIKARDIERQTDIKALHAQIEAYWAQTGNYPTLTNLNDPTFRSTNLKGLDDGALKDPQGTGHNLESKPKAGSYAYEVSPTNCDNVKTVCTSYRLTSTNEQELNGVKVYYKNSLNN